MKRERQEFTEEFKHQMVQLRNSGKSRAEILWEYDLTTTAFDCLCKQSERSGSFKEKVNRTQEENELIKLR